ncbi:lysophospholipid acyltransferase family protein [Haliovirga abyssi]|uniref:Lipoprotein n=1 Tax=Haliovirga abyssi TaxID=2996794 RepID=A0AAU9DBK7_9FUSO|nr:lysophospholipid acyltransferase family protein [Haliovirga abyssi]BDU50650.1 lipoprotein [Haliovirga abyssi]
MSKLEEMKEEKSYRKYKRYGKILYFISKIINRTINMKVIIESDDYNEKNNYLYGFWHGSIFLPMVNMTKNGKKIANLVSPSKDGEIIATMLEMYGYELVRGSSNKNNVRSLVKLIKMVKNGYSGGFAVDGPRGPIYKVKQGIVYTAQKTGIEIVPLAGVFKNKWRFNSWDSFQFPKPFTKAIYIIGKPIKIEKDISVEEGIKLVEERLIELNKKADMMS